MRITLCILAVTLLAASRLHAQPASAGVHDAPQREQLACFALPSPHAELRLSAMPVGAGAKEGGLVIRVGPRDSVGAGAQMMLFGVSSGGGDAFDSSGTAMALHRDVGTHQLGVRAAGTQERPWRYVVTVRPGVIDTVNVNLTAPCTRVFQRPSSPR